MTCEYIVSRLMLVAFGVVLGIVILAVLSAVADHVIRSGD